MRRFVATYYNPYAQEEQVMRLEAENKRAALDVAEMYLKGLLGKSYTNSDLDNFYEEYDVSYMDFDTVCEFYKRVRGTDELPELSKRYDTWLDDNGEDD